MLKIKPVKRIGADFSIKSPKGKVCLSIATIKVLRETPLNKMGDIITSSFPKFQLRDIETMEDTFGQVGFVQTDDPHGYQLVIGRDDNDKYLITQTNSLDPDDGQYAFAVTQEQLDALLDSLKEPSHG